MSLNNGYLTRLMKCEIRNFSGRQNGALCATETPFCRPKRSGSRPGILSSFVRAEDILCTILLQDLISFLQTARHSILLLQNRIRFRIYTINKLAQQDLPATGAQRGLLEYKFFCRLSFSETKQKDKTIFAYYFGYILVDLSTVNSSLFIREAS